MSHSHHTPRVPGGCNQRTSLFTVSTGALTTAGVVTVNVADARDALSVQLSPQEALELGHALIGQASAIVAAKNAECDPELW